MAKQLYRGYSTYEYENTKDFAISDIELVKLDLLNHIYTRKGERVMMPRFGTRIPDLAFEPLDDVTLDVLRSDLQYVFNYDPRVALQNLTITPDYDTNTVVAAAKLFYIELNMSDVLYLNIEFEGGMQ